MTRTHHRIVAILGMLGVGLVSACASGGGNAEDVGMGTVEAQIWNRSDETVVIFARWGNAPRSRLGQLSGGRRGTYRTAVRGPTMAISWDVVTARPPAGTGMGFFPPVADSPGDPQCPVDVNAGERVEWTIAVGARSCSYVRLDPAQ